MLNVYQAAVLNSRYSAMGLRFKPVKEEKEHVQETQAMQELENSSKSRIGGATRNWQNSTTTKENVQPNDPELPMTAMKRHKDQRQSRMDEYVNAPKQPVIDAANPRVKKG
jgi:hypothetical protein